MTSVTPLKQRVAAANKTTQTDTYIVATSPSSQSLMMSLVFLMIGTLSMLDWIIRQLDAMRINVLPAFKKIHCVLCSRICFIGEIVLVHGFHSSKLFQCITSKTESLFTFMHTLPFLLTLANGAYSVCIQARNITLKQQVKYDLRYLAQGAKERSRAFLRC